MLYHLIQFVTDNIKNSFHLPRQKYYILKKKLQLSEGVVWIWIFLVKHSIARSKLLKYRDRFMTIFSCELFINSNIVNPFFQFLNFTINQLSEEIQSKCSVVEMTKTEFADRNPNNGYLYKETVGWIFMHKKKFNTGV